MKHDFLNKKKGDLDDWLPFIIGVVLIVFIIFFLGTIEQKKQGTTWATVQEQTTRMGNLKNLMDFLDKPVDENINYGGNSDTIAQEASQKGLRIIDLIALNEDNPDLGYSWIVKKMAFESFGLYYGIESWKFSVEYQDPAKNPLAKFETGKEPATNYNTEVYTPSFNDIAIISLKTKR